MKKHEAQKLDLAQDQAAARKRLLELGKLRIEASPEATPTAETSPLENAVARPLPVPETK